jgi:alpha-tubulin suppressor-like RCC1 family protein
MPRSGAFTGILFALLAVSACDKKTPDPVAPIVDDADRVIQSMTVSAGTYRPLDHVIMHFSVRNDGADNAPASPATFRLSSDATITSADRAFGSAISIPPIDAGDSTGTIAVEQQLPDTVSPGTYFVGLLVGDDDSAPDPDTTNNGAGSSIAIEASYLAMPNRLSVAISPGYCATSATKAVYCWGPNQRWQFGASTPANGSNVPYLTAVPLMDKLSRGNGNDHMCGLVGTAATCWGRADAGMLGNGVFAPGSFSEPVSVSGGIAWADVTVSQLTACGVATNGTGYCWGANQKGEIGNVSVNVGGTLNATNVGTTPKAIAGGLKFKSVVAGWLHACGIADTDRAYCWGDNSSGQLGLGSVDTLSLAHRTPAPVLGGLKFVQLALGTRQTCGITTTHEAYCWGTNGVGQLGDGTTTDRSVPTRVLATLRFSYIATSPGFGDALPGILPLQGGTSHTCALTESGAPYCWGFNLWGQLGDGTNTMRLSPVPVSGGLTFTTIATGGSSVCGMKGNQIRCWGANGSGQLGIGGGADSNVPVVLPAPFATP